LWGRGICYAIAFVGKAFLLFEALQEERAGDPDQDQGGDDADHAAFLFGGF
jgi:hypothetical protein